MSSGNFNLESIKNALRDLPLGGILFEPQMSSTNDVALDWLISNGQDMSLVITNHQTAGRGRKQRKWISPSDSSLTFSVILTPALNQTEVIGLYSALGALAVVRAIKELDSQMDLKIKWPNDILLNGKKVCGILTESTWLGNKVEKIIIGIGINTSTEAVPHPELITYPASSLEDYFGYKVDRLDLLHKIILEILFLRQKIGSGWFINNLEGFQAFWNELVEVWEDGFQARAGVLLGMAKDGGLRLMDSSGDEFHVHVGELHLRSRGDTQLSKPEH